MNRQYPTRPFIGVGGVVWRGDQFLLIQQDRPQVGSIWTLPGGLQELGEGVRDALVREVYEETNLEVEVGALLDIVDGIFRDPSGRVEYHYTLLDFHCTYQSGEAVAASDAEAVRWVNMDDLASLEIWSETKRIIELSVNQKIN